MRRTQILTTKATFANNHVTKEQKLFLLGNYSYVESSQSPSNSSQNISPIEEEREYDSVPEEETIRVIEPYPGSYCLSSHSELPVVNRGTEWNSQPSKGILASNGKLAIYFRLEKLYLKTLLDVSMFQTSFSRVRNANFFYN